MGESITKEKITSHFPSLSAANELDFVLKLKNAIKNNGFEQIMKVLGAERVKLYGWYDTYSFTKAISEMVIDGMREDIPILIIRPSTITSSYEQPFPGWVQGFRVIDLAIVFYGKGDFSGALGDPNHLIDVVPVDVVVNTTMTAIAKHGYLQSPELNVYHVASSSVNPLLFSQIIDYCYEFFNSSPFVNSKGDEVKVKKMIFFNNILDFSNYMLQQLNKQHDKVQDLVEVEHSKMQMHIKKKMKYFENFSKVYEPYGFYKGQFDT